LLDLRVTPDIKLVHLSAIEDGKNKISSRRARDRILTTASII